MTAKCFISGFRTHLANKANVKKIVLYETTNHETVLKARAALTSFTTEKKVIKSDVSNGVRRCNVVLTLERGYKYVYKTFAKQSSFWRDFFSEMAECSEKRKSSNVFSLFTIGIIHIFNALAASVSNNNLEPRQMYMHWNKHV